MSDDPVPPDAPAPDDPSQSYHGDGQGEQFDQADPRHAEQPTAEPEGQG